MGNSIGIKVCVFVADEDKLLLLKEWSNKKNGYFRNVIKGTYDDTAESLLDCAKREAMEEAGIEIELTGLINCTFCYGEKTMLYFNFVAKNIGAPVLASTGEQDKRGEDIKELGFIKKSEIKNMKREDFISDGVYESVQEWLKNNPFSLETVKQVRFK